MDMVDEILEEHYQMLPSHRKRGEQRPAPMQNPFKNMTAQQKNMMQMQGEVLGLSPAEVVQEVTMRGGLSDKARELGFDERSMQALSTYKMPDKVEQTAIRAEAFGDVLNKNFNEYADKAGTFKDTVTIQGVSPWLAINQIAGRNKKDQIAFLTAQGLARDTAVQQVLMSGMRAGHFSVEAIEKALQHTTPGFQYVDADVRQGVINNIHKVFKEGMHASSKALTPKELFARQLRQHFSEPEQVEEMQETIVRYSSPDGRTFSIPSNRADAIQEAERRGWERIQ